MKRITIATITMLTGFIFGVQAQEAKPGSSGIYIDLGKTIPRHISYSISRKAADSTIWKEIAGIRFQADSSVFFASLSHSGAKYPTFKMPEQRFFSNIWKMIETADLADSVFYYGNTPAFKEALGTAFYDQTALPNVEYQYKIITKGYSGQQEKIIGARFPEAVKTDYQLVTQTITAFNENQVLRYYSNGIHKPAGIALLRQVYMQTDFEPASAHLGIVQQGDSTIYLVTDTVIKPGIVYQYVAIPFDDLGNSGLPSDTIRISNTTFNNTPFVTDVKTTSIEKESAIKLDWKLNKTASVVSVGIYRSESHDGAEYKLVGTVAASDTVFLDKTVHPVKNYFYSLQPVTIYGPGSMSIRFSGMLKANKKAAAPGRLTAITENGKVKLSWKRPEFYTRGYYIFRRNGADSLKQISDLIVTDSVQVTFYDTIEAAQNNMSYTYAVKAVNTSYNISAFSETANVITPASIKLNTPMNVRTIIRDDRIMIRWQNRQAGNVLAYQVYKRRFNDPDTASSYKLVNTSPLHFSVNYCEDSTVVKGVNYEYAIQAVSAGGQLSALSAAVSAGIVAKRILPAGGLRAGIKDQSVVLAWDITAQTDVTGYKIYRMSGELKTLLATLDKANDFYEDKSPATKNLNTYVITCTSETGESAESMPISIRLKQRL